MEHVIDGVTVLDRVGVRVTVGVAVLERDGVGAVLRVEVELGEGDCVRERVSVEVGDFDLDNVGVVVCAGVAGATGSGTSATPWYETERPDDWAIGAAA